MTEQWVVDRPCPGKLDGVPWSPLKCHRSTEHAEESQYVNPPRSIRVSEGSTSGVPDLNSTLRLKT